ncbi:MAG TPA: pentapeptide repeat-containing protein [Bellilinea sp.]|nr:pentapeptide repeat-containing protein [Bellilinea sp.]
MPEIQSNSEYQGEKYKNLNFEQARIQRTEFVNCTFNRVNLREADFLYSKFHECTFTNCDLSLSSVKGCVFNQVRFEDCTLVGINWIESAWGKSRFSKPADFYRCALNYGTFVGLNLKTVKLSGCTIHNVDFSDVDLTGADCTKSDFTNSRFNHTNLTEADFRGATNYVIAPNDNILKKTHFTLPEAMALLYGLDIILEDLE